MKKKWRAIYKRIKGEYHMKVATGSEKKYKQRQETKGRNNDKTRLRESKTS